MSRALLAACLVLVSLCSSACGLVFGGSRQVVHIDSTPTAARVQTQPATADHTTPASMSLQRRQNYALTLSAPGYSSQTIELQREMRVGIVVLDIVLGLVPVIVDAATGAWYRLEPSRASVTLTRATASADQPDTITVGLTLTGAPAVARLRVQSSAPGVRAVLTPR